MNNSFVGLTVSVKIENFEKSYGAHQFIAELRRPEGPPSGAPYPYREEKETHELIFSWLSWLAVLLVGAHAQDGAILQRTG